MEQLEKVIRRLNRAEKGIIWLGLLALPFGDLPLRQSFLGAMGANASLILFGVAFGIWTIQRTLRIRISHSFTINRWILIFLLVEIIINIAAILFFGMRCKNELLLIKGLKLCILWTLVLYVCTRNLSDHFYKNAIMGAIVITILGLLFENHLGLLHGIPNFNMRPRGLSAESSHLAANLGLLMMIWAATKSQKTKLFCLLCTIFIMFYIRSKGGLIIIGLSAAFYTIFLLRSWLSARVISLKKFVTVTSLILTMLIVALIVTIKLKEMFVIDILYFTSAGTRLCLALTALLIGASSVTGVGFTGYLPALVTYIPTSVNWLKQMGIQLNFDEVLRFVSQASDTSITTKSFWLDNIIIFGLLFIFIFLVLHLWLWMKKTNPWIRTMLLATLLTLFWLEPPAVLTPFVAYSYILNWQDHETACYIT